jgi:hypothetical protein
MRIALVLTTINIPTVLALYRKCDPAVKFFVAMDEKTPDEAVEFMKDLGVSYHLAGTQKWKCSEAIGWNCLQRRNIGFLEALKDGAELIITIDDDNMPVTDDYFSRYSKIFRAPFNGIKVSGKQGWFDPGQFLVPPVVQRGFPIQVKHRPKFEPVTDAKVGVASGLILGDSDMDAYTRIGKAPTVGGVAMLAQVGCVVDPHTYTIFNSQNSCLIRELVPAYFLMPGVGRYDDVYASLIVQRVARERGYHVHLGQPLALQERNEHDPMTDLRAEIEGMSYCKVLADLLDSIPLPGKSVIEDTRIIYEQLCFCQFIPQESATAGLVWLDDVETVF